MADEPNTQGSSSPESDSPNTQGSNSPEGDSPNPQGSSSPEGDSPTRIVHYINQFYGGVGREEAADTPPEVREGPVGPGKRLQQLLDDDFEIVATLICGDDYATSTEGAIDELLELATGTEADLLVAGPAFGSGRYGLACARLAAAATEADLPAIAAMHPDNPGVEDAGAAPVIESGGTSRDMRSSLDQLAPAVAKFAAGESLTSDDGRVDRLARRNTTADDSAAERALDLILRRLAGDEEATEIPQPRFDVVNPAGPVEDLSQVTLALVTEGAVVPAGNPDRLPSSRATKWLKYSLDGEDSLRSGEYESVDGGFSTVAADEDPNRILPLDMARELERDEVIGKLHDSYLVTIGNGTPVATARGFGVEWAAELHKANVQAAILTAT